MVEVRTHRARDVELVLKARLKTAIYGRRLKSELIGRATELVLKSRLKTASYGWSLKAEAIGRATQN